MLKVKDLKKEYKKGEIILNDINVIFRKKEFVSILGTSGSGKSTFLNIIGNLDKNYEGDIYLLGNNISNKKSKFYDKINNQKIGFVHQEYNLIDNYSVYKNLKIPLIIGKEKNKKSKITKILTKINMLDYKNKKVKTLSGGEKQRIAIARALINDPDIILLDEPTGALDSKTSIEVMELIKKISSEKLVIMVTHDEYLAKKYSTRIIKIKDGKFISDTNPNPKEENKEDIKLKKIGISQLNSIKLALSNIKTKPLRNILTLLGFSISLIGILLVFSISTGFTSQINTLKEQTFANYPIIINSKIDEKQVQKKDKIYRYKKDLNNNINENIIEKINSIKKENTLGITYNYNYNFSVIAKNEGYKLKSDLPFIPVPNSNDYLEKNYTLLRGKLPENELEVLIKIDNNNKIDENILEFLGIKEKEISYNKLLNKELKIVLNNNLYKKTYNYYEISKADEKLYNNKENITLTITGIIKSKNSMEFNTLVNEDGGAIYFKNSLIEKVININSKSSIIKKQREQKYNILTGENINEKDKNKVLEMLGNKQYPFLIYIYPKNYSSKKIIINDLKKIDFKSNKIECIDLSEQITKNLKDIIFGITTVLLIFSFTSLIITLILIAIITYTSVLERTKEIGIFRSLGARKKDIRKIFVKETIIISLLASILSVLIVKMIEIPLNQYLYKALNLKHLLILKNDEIALIFLISIIVSILGNIIPAYKISTSNQIKNLK